jgi:glycosyltransferase involved in cell wall biosynthesis
MRIGASEAVVSIVIPCFNEEMAIGPLVADLLAAGLDEAIVVDGGSTDRTVARAEAAGAKVVVEARRGYGRACAAGVAAARSDAGILMFIDGDGSDDPRFAPAIAGPVWRGEADFVIGTRLRGAREPGSLTAQQILAAWLAGLLIRLAYGVRYTDMSPYRAIRPATLKSLGMSETTYGWNLEMQMRAAAARLRILELPVGCRARRGGTSKVSGNLAAAVPAAIVIVRPFARLFIALRSRAPIR